MLDIDLIQRGLVAVCILAAVVTLFALLMAKLLQEQSKPLVVNRPEAKVIDFTQPAAKGGEWREQRRERRTS